MGEGDEMAGAEDCFVMLLLDVLRANRQNLCALDKQARRKETMQQCPVVGNAQSEIFWILLERVNDTQRPTW